MKNNLNRKIKIKLTQYGIDILNERYSQMGYYKQPDSNGYFTFSMWEFINIYWNCPLKDITNMEEKEYHSIQLRRKRK